MNLLRFAWLLTVFALSSTATTAAEQAARTQPQSKAIRANHGLFHPGALAILPDDGRQIYLGAFA